MTTTRLTHATPASLFARAADRSWECDVSLLKRNLTGKVKDIARQLIEEIPGKRAKVILGGGRGAFMPAEDK